MGVEQRPGIRRREIEPEIRPPPAARRGFRFNETHPEGPQQQRPHRCHHRDPVRRNGDGFPKPDPLPDAQHFPVQGIPQGTPPQQGIADHRRQHTEVHPGGAQPGGHAQGDDQGQALEQQRHQHHCRTGQIKERVHQVGMAQAGHGRSPPSSSTSASRTASEAVSPGRVS